MKLLGDLKQFSAPAVQRAANQVLGLLLTLMLARWLTPADFGIYSLFIAIMAVLCLPFQGGVAELVFRSTLTPGEATPGEATPGVATPGEATRETTTFLSTLKKSASLTAVATLVIACVTLAIRPWLPESSQLFTAFIPLVFLLAVSTSTAAGVLRGSGRIHSALLSDPGIRYVVMMTALAALMLTQGGFSVTTAISMLAAGYAAALVFAVMLATSNVRRVTGSQETLSWRGYLTAVVALLASSVGVQLNANIDIIMLGMLVSAETVASYKIAALIGLQVAFPVWLINTLFAGRIAAAIEAGDSDGILTLFRRARNLGALTGTGIMVFAVVSYEYLVGLLFGEAYVANLGIMVLLGLAHLASLMLGPVGLTLLLLKRERQAARIAMATAAINLLLNPLLIMIFGAIGAALATLLAILLWRVMLTIEFNGQLRQMA